MGRFNKFDNLTNYDAATKRMNGSEASLILNSNEVIFDGVNVVVDNPHIGDIVIWDSTLLKKRYIAYGTYDKKTFSTLFTVLGVVYHIEGRKVYVTAAANYNFMRWSNVYEWMIKPSQWDATNGGTGTLKLHSLNTDKYSDKVATVTVTYIGGLSTEAFAQILQDAYNEQVGDGKYSFYEDVLPDNTSIIRVCWMQYNEYPSKGATWNGSGLSTANGDELGVVYKSDIYRRNVNNTSVDLAVYGAINPKRCTQGWYSTSGREATGDADLASGTTDPLRKTAFTAEKNPKTYAMYGGDYERYMREWFGIRFPFSKGAATLNDGKYNTDLLGDATYRVSTTGERKIKYPYLNYCKHYGVTIDGADTGLEPGNWYGRSFQEMCWFESEITYGLTGINSVTSEGLDPVNKSLLQLGYNGKSVASGSWSASRSSDNRAWWQDDGGYVKYDSYLYRILGVLVVSAFEIENFTSPLS